MFSKTPTCSFYFTNEFSRQILDTCPWRSLFLEKIVLANLLPVQFHETIQEYDFEKKWFFKNKPLAAASDYCKLGCMHLVEKPVLVNKKIFEKEKQQTLNKHIFENT